MFIPFGSNENHGPHNDKLCDFIIAQDICKKLAKFFKGQVSKKVMKKGAEGIPPTDEYSYTEFYNKAKKCILKSLKKADLLVIVNGHGTNKSILMDICRVVSLKEETPIILIDWPELISETRFIMWSEKKWLNHAGVIETSVLMAVSPKSVKLEKAVDDERALRDLTAWKRRKIKIYPIKYSKTGVYGVSKCADKELGKKVLNLVLSKAQKEITQFIKEKRLL